MLDRVNIMIKSLKVADQVIENLMTTILSAKLMETKSFKIVLATDKFKIKKEEEEIIIITDKNQVLKFGDELASVCRTREDMVMPTLYAMTQTLDILKDENHIKDYDICGNNKNYLNTTSALISINI